MSLGNMLQTYCFFGRFYENFELRGERGRANRRYFLGGSPFGDGRLTLSMVTYCMPVALISQLAIYMAPAKAILHICGVLYVMLLIWI